MSYSSSEYHHVSSKNWSEQKHMDIAPTEAG